MGLESYIGQRFNDIGRVPPVDGFRKLHENTTVEELKILATTMATDKTAVDKFLEKKGLGHMIPGPT